MCANPNTHCHTRTPKPPARWQLPPTLIYAVTTREVDEIAAYLNRPEALAGRAGRYHAKLPAADRRAAHTAFMRDDLDVLVASVAYGACVRAFVPLRMYCRCTAARGCDARTRQGPGGPLGRPAAHGSPERRVAGWSGAGHHPAQAYILVPTAVGVQSQHRLILPQAPLAPARPDVCPPALPPVSAR